MSARTDLDVARRTFLLGSVTLAAGSMLGCKSTAPNLRLENTNMSTHANPVALDYRNNQFGLVYEGAIAKNEAGKVNLRPVTYKLNGLDISANVYTPANYDPKRQYPAVAVAHPNGGVKEQTAGLYAQRLAELGYLAIAADASFQGASGPRGPRSVAITKPN